MGLNTTHNAWYGPYSAFNRFRQCICEAMGGESSFGPHWIYGPGGSIGEFPAPKKPGLLDTHFYVDDAYPESQYPGLWELLRHSDCDGEISPEMCVHVADELEVLLPKIEALGWVAGGSIAARGGFVEVTRQFIAGCRAAAAAGEPLVFH